MKLTEIFAEYGDDATGALEAYANVDPRGWSEFMDTSAEATYRRRYAAWMRNQKVQIFTDKDQRQLFDGMEHESVQLRARVVSRRDGRRVEHAITALAGPEGVEILRAIADRDEAPARSTLIHANMLRRIADEVERLSKIEGRPVSVAEVLGLEAA